MNRLLSPNHKSLTLGAPVPTIMIGLSAVFNKATKSLIALGSGAGSLTGKAVILPQATLSTSTGVKSTSIGKSSSTGPGAPEPAVLHAKLTSLGISRHVV